MKLSSKIFLGIFIPSIVIIVCIVSILIHSNFNSELNLESDKSIQEFNAIIENFNSNINEEVSYYALINYYQNHFKSKNIYFEYYSNHEQLIDSGGISLKNHNLLEVEEHKYNLLIEENDEKHYIFVSYKVDEDVLVYKKNIDRVYDNYQRNINLSIILLVVLSFVFLVVAYLVSKFITIPLNAMTKEMEKISKKDYNIKLKEGKDEIGRVAKKFNEMSKKIEENEKEMLNYIESKQLFIDNLAHEMNTPLTSIKGYAEALEKFDLTEEQRIKYLTYIQSESNRISDMYKKLLFLSYKSNVDYEPKTVLIDKVLETIQIDLKNRLEEHETKLIIDNKHNEFYGDEIMLVMAISNLVRNALNNSEPNTNIYINTYATTTNFCIEVADEGIGISEENISKILEPFYRVDKARSRKNGGAGLGLSLVQHILKLHNGQLKIESEPGKGSKFILLFERN